MTATSTQSARQISDILETTCVMFDPDVPPTIPPDMTIREYRIERTRAAGQRRRGLGRVLGRRAA